MTIALSLCLACSIAAKEVEEVWTGRLAVEFVEKNSKKGRGKRRGNDRSLTLRVTRKGNVFTGEWIEDARILEIQGTISGKKWTWRPTRVKKGEWKNDVVKNLQFTAEVKDDDMQGRMFGVGAGRARGGGFVLKKQ